jgi:hypothetical protein
LLALDHVFDELGLHRVELAVFAFNHRARRLYQRLRLAPAELPPRAAWASAAVESVTDGSRTTVVRQRLPRRCPHHLLRGTPMTTLTYDALVATADAATARRARRLRGIRRRERRVTIERGRCVVAAARGGTREPGRTAVRARTGESRRHLGVRDLGRPARTVRSSASV